MQEHASVVVPCCVRKVVWHCTLEQYISQLYAPSAICRLSSLTISGPYTGAHHLVAGEPSFQYLRLLPTGEHCLASTDSWARLFVQKSVRSGIGVTGRDSSSSSSSNIEHHVSQHIVQRQDSSNTGSGCISNGSSGAHLSAKTACCFAAITLNCSLHVFLPAHVYELHMLQRVYGLPRVWRLMCWVYHTLLSVRASCQGSPKLHQHLPQWRTVIDIVIIIIKLPN
jgi:hypothetical protein